ncbi:hypothetical protein HZ326_19997 [Fusarium oxysporum f. sp. albedinis]|nr:hypothetical protein HZ326_19997 [Fusarium oxysporum f. sp. albedinis]
MITIGEGKPCQGRICGMIDGMAPSLWDSYLKICGIFKWKSHFVHLAIRSNIRSVYGTRCCTCHTTQSLNVTRSPHAPMIRDCLRICGCANTGRPGRSRRQGKGENITLNSST